LDDLQRMLTELNKTYEDTMEKKRIIEEEMAIMESRKVAADKLISGLSSEKLRWAGNLEELKHRLRRLLGDTLISASFLVSILIQIISVYYTMLHNFILKIFLKAYVGAFTWEFRRELIVELWEKDLLEKQIPTSQPLHFDELLTSDVEISKWTSEGLPPDELSV
ncbi:unnamed protein product, partial [Didymodactylos carnosus]